MDENGDKKPVVNLKKAMFPDKPTDKQKSLSIQLESARREKE